MNSEESGAAAVELALVLPLLLFMLFGLVQIVVLINTRTILEHAAGEAVRTAVVNDDPGKAEQRALRVSAAAPRGAGFIGGRPKVTLAREGDAVIAEVRAEVILLPFFRQVSLAAGGDGTLDLRVRARRRKEPYLGYR